MGGGLSLPGLTVPSLEIFLRGMRGEFVAGRMRRDAASSGGEPGGEALRVMGLGWSIFGYADTAAEERGQPCRAETVTVKFPL